MRRDHSSFHRSAESYFWLGRPQFIRPAGMASPRSARLIPALLFALWLGSAACLALLVAKTRSRHGPPPAADAAWHWAAAGPGMNIYYADRGRSANGIVKIWIERRLFRNPSGIEKDLVEGWNFDCRLGRVRREEATLSGPPEASPPKAAWMTPQPPALQRLLRSVCADAGLP
jgi:hypothetical protein